MISTSTCLWFSGNAEEAVQFYLSIFKNGKVLSTSYYSDKAAKDHDRPQNSVLAQHFEMNGQKYIALNAEPIFKFTEAISFVVECDTQEEIDNYWKKLTADGGQEVQCGWLKDKFGLSWQVTPKELDKMMSDPDKKKVARVTEAFMKMIKFDIEKLRKAYNS